MITEKEKPNNITESGSSYRLQECTIKKKASKKEYHVDIFFNKCIDSEEKKSGKQQV